MGLDIVPEDVSDHLDELIHDNKPEDALILFFQKVVGVSDAELEIIRTQELWPSRVAAAHTIPRETRIEAEYSLDLRRLHDLHVPTLLLLGGNCLQAFRAAVTALYEALPNSHVQELAGQQHIAMDTAPELLIEAVSSFMLRSDGERGTAE